MKRSWLRILALVLILFSLTAQAETWYVNTPNGKSLNLRSPQNNAVIGNIPNGTMLESDDILSNPTAAYVTWAGKSGFVKKQFLSKEPPKSAKAAAVTPRPAVQTVASSLLPTDGDGAVTVQAYGAYIEYSANKKKGKFSAVSFDKSVKLSVTADLPKGKSIDYWVIDGVRYDFKSRIPTSFTLDNITDSVIVEAVAKNANSETLLTEDVIQQIRTGETLIVDTKHAKLAHVRADLKGGGGWITSFNFTDDYKNRATNRIELGGQVTVRVKATIPKGKKISYWKFNDLHIDFNKNVTEMIVHTLNVSKTYEPVFGKAKVTQSDYIPPDDPPADEYFTVTCLNCTFSGGGYTNAKYGEVKAGTKITVTNKTGSSEVSHWVVNGSTLKTTKSLGIFNGKRTKIRVDLTTNTITRTINKNTKIECYGIIN